MALVASAGSLSPLQTHRSSRTPNPKRVEGSPRAVLGTHEASIRGFKIDLGSSQADPPEKKAPEKQEFQEKLPPTTPPPNEALPLDTHSTDTKEESPEPCSSRDDQNADVNADVKGDAISQGLPKTVTEKAVTSGGFRSIRFRSRSGKQEKDGQGGQGNRVFPSEKQHPVEKRPVGPPPGKEAKLGGAGFSYSMLFSSRKQGGIIKKEGQCKGEALVMKNRTDSTLMRSLLRRPAPGPSPAPITKPGSHCIASKKTTKSSKKVNVEVDDVEEVEPAQAMATAATHADSSEEPSSPAHDKLLEKPKDGSLVQARYRSIDDVFPELPLEEEDVGAASPDLGKTIKAVEDQFLGFGSQGEMASFDCRSIERMFGKGISRVYNKSVAVSPTSPDFSSLENPAPETSPISPEVYVTECGGGVPGTFPSSPLVKYEKIFFTSRSHLHLQDMFEVVSGDHRSHDLAGRRRSFCLSEPRERILSPPDDEEAGDTCSNSAACATGGTPARLEIQKMAVDAGWSEDVATPPALKKFEEKLAQASLDSDDSHVLCVEECGQPSPVSVLESPFLDEVPTTPDASLAESQQMERDLNDIREMELSAPEEEEKVKAKAKVSEVGLQDMIETEKIKQAIRDISRFRNIDVATVGLEPPTIAPVDPQQEQNFIREVLDAANLLREGECGPWYSPDQSLFDRLEFGSIKLDERTLMESKRWGDLPDAPRQGSSIRSERKLLFDCVNEVMVLEPWMKTSSFHVDLPMFPDMHANSKFRSPISGEILVKEVYRMICHWRDIAGNVLDDLIDYDMNVPEGRWVDFAHEAADVGLDIERALLKVMIQEVVDELVPPQRALTTS